MIARATMALLWLISAAPATRPTTSPGDSVLWHRLSEIDNRAASVKTLSARFDQQKFTTLLRRPLVSSGQVRVSGSVMRWDTQKPEPNVLLVDPHEARFYYPTQKALEIYPLDERLGELAASPLPRLELLRARFSFEQVPVSELDPAADASRFVALKLTPTDPSLREHVRQVRVLLDARQACIVKAEITDGDGDRTTLSFSDVHINPDVGDLTLKVPPGTAVARPLEGLDGQTRGKSK